MITLHVKKGGDIWTLGDLPDGMLPEYTRSKRRVSHILPVHPVKRLAFRFLRMTFGERGRVAAWTRSWKGPWQASIIGSHRYFSHMSRRVCLEWERAVIEGGGL